MSENLYRYPTMSTGVISCGRGRRRSFKYKEIVYISVTTIRHNGRNTALSYTKPDASHPLVTYGVLRKRERSCRCQSASSPPPPNDFK